jgi:hypothetical protein
MKHLGKQQNEYRHGVCHRCGWKVPVTNVRATTRIVQRSLRGYGRLCAECRAALLHEHLPFLPPHKARSVADVETKRDRHVA